MGLMPHGEPLVPPNPEACRNEAPANDPEYQPGPQTA
jgi:hypothetical protein